MNYFREKRDLRLFATITLIFLAPTSPVSAAAPGERSGTSGPVNVIFDTDMCLDHDDAMALAIVHALHDRHEVNLVAVTVGLDEKWCVPYVDVLNTFYGHPSIPIGTIRNGLSVETASKRILNGLEENGWPREKQKQSDDTPRDTFAQYILKQKNSDGLPLYRHRLTDGSQAPEAVFLLRKTLAHHPDASVVMIQVGNSANFAALLDSRPDTVSDLSGVDLIKQKVRFLSVMAGTFHHVKLNNGWTMPKGAGINIFEDVSSAKKVFSRWPTPVVVGGVEIGEAVRFPGISIQHDFSYASNHPISETHRYIYSVSPTAKSLPDHHTCDPAPTLYALRPDRNYYSLSNPGKITVFSNGNVRFDEEKNGNHRYLIASEEQKVRAQEAMTMLVSQPPVNMNR